MGDGYPGGGRMTPEESEAGREELKAKMEDFDCA